MMRWIATWLLLAGLCWMVAPLAQVPENPRLRVFGPGDGLPTTAISALARDRDGFIWAASSDGLARYDGNGFRVWRHDVAEPRSLSANAVQALHVDGHNRLWVASEFGGIGMLDARRDGFRHWRRRSHPQLRSDEVFAFASRDDGLWIGTGGAGLYRMSLAGDPAGWQPQAVPGLPSAIVTRLAFDTAGQLWIATAEGLAMLEGGRVRAVRLPGDAPFPFVHDLMVDGARLWVATTAGVFLREADGRWSEPWAGALARTTTVISFARDRDGAIWLGSQRGLWRVDGAGLPKPVPTDPAYLTGSVQALLVDSDGGLWSVMPGVGLGYLRPDWRVFARYRQGEEGYRVAAPAKAGGVWVAGSERQVDRIDGSGVAARVDRVVRQQLPAIRPSSMTEDARGQLWIQYGRLGLWRIGSGGRLDHWPPGNGADAADGAGYRSMAASGDALWLVGHERGLELRDAVSGRVLRRFDAAAAGLGDGEITMLRIGPDGRAWLAGSFGLGWMDGASGRLVVPPALAGQRVLAFAFDGGDALWLHRADGLARYRGAGKDWQQVARLPAGRYMPSLEPDDMVVDSRGRPWLASQRGLYRWDPARRHMTRFGIENGLGSQEFRSLGMALSEGGMLAAIARDGNVVLVDTRHPDAPARTPPLRIDGIDVRRNGAWLAQAATAALSFGPDDREFRFNGHLLAFDDPTGTRYWSRLEGFDRDWVDQGALGERVFSGLAPGSYRLRMRAQDAAGNPAREQQLEFTIQPPWWRTPWAWLGYATLALGLIAWLVIDYRRRTSRAHALALAEQERMLAQQASQAKTRFLATFGHEIRTPMTGVLGMAELLQATPLDAGQRGQVDAILRAGNHLLRLLNDALDLARIEADKLVLADEPFNLHALLQEADALMRPLATRKGLAFSIDVEPGLAPDWVGDRTRIGQILFNLLGNAIKFTSHGDVGLGAEVLQGGGLRLRVHDTGPGLNAAQRQRLFQRFEQADGARTSARYGGSGLGLAISQELAAAMGGRIRVQSTPGLGTRFNVELPLREAPMAALARGPAAGMDAAAPASMQLLLVEDDATVAEVMVALLRAQGHAVRHAPHGLAALAEMASARFDAALLDLDLPGLDGFALARQLRRGGFEGPLLAVTARADNEAEAQAREAGFDAFVRKPVSAAILSQGLRDAAQAGAQRLL